MATEINAERLKYLWLRWTAKTATAEEADELLNLLRNHPVDELQAFIPIDPGNISPKEKMDEAAKIAMLQAILQKPKSATIPLNLLRYAAAAIVIFAVSTVTYFYFSSNEKQVLVKAEQISQTPKDILPGTQRATLTLNDGSTIELDSAGNGVLAEQYGAKISKDGARIVYLEQTSSLSPNSSSPAYNTMSTPRGGLYSLVLPDGTKVWLNAASSITYPTKFTGNTREVSITGELYFEVTKNAAKPFIVKTYKEEITVRGTSFNVNSYTDEHYVKTSLLEGSVWIGNDELKPGQAYMNGKVFKADVNMDVAWKNGSFAFKNANLETVMRQLARWYNLEVVYEGKVPAGTFSGEIGRSLTLNQLLKGLTTTKVKYRLENGNRIVIISD